MSRTSLHLAVQLGLTASLLSCPLFAQQPTPTTATAKAPATAATVHYKPAPALDLSAIDKSANPCNDFYKFACGNYAASHPIPADQPDVDQFYTLHNVNTQELNGILTRYADASNEKTPNEQKIGADYAACMDTALIDQRGMAPVQPLLNEIDRANKFGLPTLIGKLQRMGVNVFFGFGNMPDFKDSTMEIAVFDQGGLGLPERDYYTRTGARDVKLREEYVDHVAKMLTLAGEPAEQASTDAKNILAFETELAKASLTVTEQRDPANIYHPETLASFEKSLPGVNLHGFLETVHAPEFEKMNDASPAFFPAMLAAIRSTDMETLRAYMRYHLLTTFASNLPHAVDQENFHFYATVMRGQPEQSPRWKRCSAQVDSQLGEALGQVYVQQYFAGDSKAKTLQVVHDIEGAMKQDIQSLTWMSPETKKKAEAKLAMIADKIGYPDKWRDYSKLTVSRTDAFGNEERANEFENDRELNKIGKPVDRMEWQMTPPTVNAYYDPTQNNINFPAGILQPAFYDPNASLAVNYGHIGAVVGHELTHGFDDQGSQFDGEGNLKDWWTPEDKKQFQERTGCLVHEYGDYVAVDNVHVNGKLTLGENTADNGGLVLAYMAYLERAKKDGIDIHKNIDGYTGPQRFYIAFAQNWCENTRPATTLERVQTDAHSPDHIRANGAIVNQPGFAAAFGCKEGSPMVPADACRVW